MNLFWDEARRVTEQEYKAIDKVLKLVYGYWNDDGVQDAIDAGSLSINNCVNNRNAVLYRNEFVEKCVYVDTLEEIRDIDMQLVKDELQEAAMEFYRDYVEKLGIPMNASFRDGWRKLCSIFSKYDIEYSLHDFICKEIPEQGMTDFYLALREGTDNRDVFITYSVHQNYLDYDAEDLYKNDCYLGCWNLMCYGAYYIA